MITYEHIYGHYALKYLEEGMMVKFKFNWKDEIGIIRSIYVKDMPGLKKYVADILLSDESRVTVDIDFLKPYDTEHVEKR